MNINKSVSKLQNKFSIPVIGNNLPIRDLQLLKRSVKQRGLTNTYRNHPIVKQDHLFINRVGAVADATKQLYHAKMDNSKNLKQERKFPVEGYG